MYKISSSAVHGGMRFHVFCVSNASTLNGGEYLMVQEYRKIIFSTDELMSALALYRQIMPTFIPEGKIVRCSALEYGAVKVILQTSEGEKAQQTSLILQGVDVLKPVIGFCIEHKIMLPKAGRKSIEVQRGSVVLRVDLNLKIELPELAIQKEENSKVPRS
jgi:hypothetical protein